MSRKFIMLSVAALCLTTGIAHAADGDMRVSDFLETARRLEARGALALFSSDFRRLQREVDGGFASYRDRLQADREAGRAPHSCPPSSGGVRTTSDEIVAHFRSYPQARREQINVRQALADMMRQRFPC